MGRILIVYEERCGDCHEYLRETAHEMEDFYSNSGNGGTTVKRRTILRRCKKCEPIFRQKIDEADKAGKVQRVPYGKSGQDEEDRKTTFRDFLGRDKNKRKREVASEDHLL